MGSLNSHEEMELPCATETPLCRDFSSLDPRSPTLEIARTPIEVPAAHRSRLRRLVSLLDPRSPGLHLNRTPLQLPQEVVQPTVELQETDLGKLEASASANVSQQAGPEEETGHVDLKTARALFFGDMTVSPASSPVSKNEQSPARVQPSEKEVIEPELIEDEEDEVEEASAKLVECEAIAVVELACDASGLATKIKCIEGAELCTPTAVPRRPGKENALKKQLFNTPDKARVRTPLSNVSSFHNSPLRRN